MVVSGTRESEHPIQRISGLWPAARRGKSCGWVVAVFSAHSLFCRMASWTLSGWGRGWLVFLVRRVRVGGGAVLVEGGGG